MKKPEFSKIAALSFFGGVFANLSQATVLRLFIGTFYGTEILFGLFMAIWLLGISVGSAWGAVRSPSCRANFWLLALSPLVALVGLSAGIEVLPPCTGGFLPILPVSLLMVLVIFPLTVPIGVIIPSLLKGGQKPLAPLYCAEALGGFGGGIIFSLGLGGIIPPISLILSMPVLLFSALTLFSPKKLIPATFALIWPFIALGVTPRIVTQLENYLWERFRPGIARVATLETPYQRIQLGDYEGQKSLYIDGAYATSWPDQQRSEERVHFFATALATCSKILIIGAPTPDLLDEFRKYNGLVLTIVEIDQRLMNLMSNLASPSKDILWLEADPRLFLRTDRGVYDGILILSSDPTTLLANRLFTVEAFADIARRLSRTGVLSISVTGTENYLGPSMEQVFLSTHRTLANVFPQNFAIPGDPFIFWAARTEGVLETDPLILGKRFASRNIPTYSFQQLTFSNLLLPFRVQELKEWIDRKVTVPLNEDTRPRAFRQQLRLWDIFSSSKLGPVLEYLEECTGKPVLLILIFLFSISLGVFAFLPFKWRIMGTSLLSATISGSLGLLTEMILMFLYQNRQGAMFQMAAMFFGVYMLGLASGGIASTRFNGNVKKTLLFIKILQILISLLILFLIPMTEWHGTNHIGIAIFMVAFLAGWEFPLLDVWQRSLGFKPACSAGILMFTDNLGAVGVALLAGPWFLPILGIRASLFFVVVIFFMNFIFLLFAKK